MNVLCVGREAVYSPGKVEADRAILEAVAARLEGHHRVRVVSADSPLPDPAAATLVLAMCQGPAALRALYAWQRAGIRVVNTPQAIENCHRQHMLPALRRAAVSQPASLLVASGAAFDAPEWTRHGVWLKRGDVHATCADDVVLVREPVALRAALEVFHRRGIEIVAVQQHVDGEVIKFYAVQGTFFAAFGEGGAALDLAGEERRALVSLVEGAAAALGLELFGGDCVREANGRLWLVDLNDWPSYGPCRAAAAEAIVQYCNAQSMWS